MLMDTLRTAGRFFFYLSRPQSVSLVLEASETDVLRFLL